MANPVSVLVVTHMSEASGDVTSIMNASEKRPLMNRLIDYLSGLAGGAKRATVEVMPNAVAATGTITFSGTGAANDTILINGVTFTAKASGATGDQWNVGASAAASATALAAAINNSSTALVNKHVTASDDGAGVVTLTAKVPGHAGNAITLAEGVDSGSAMAESGARLTGGTVGSDTTVSFA